MANTGSLLQDRRTVPALNAIVGALMLALWVVMEPTNDGGIGAIAMALGGVVLVLAGVLGFWRPTRLGVSLEDRWIVVVYVVGILLLVASLLVWSFYT